MKILIADDDRTSLRLLEAALVKWGYEVTATNNGEEAWQQLQRPDAPSLLILDWMMPLLDGVEICRRIRALPGRQAPYIILLTGKLDKLDVVKGLEAGADDYVTKPFDPGELRARVHVGTRVLTLQAALADRVQELEEAITRVTQLHGLLPICCYCKKIRDDGNYWHQVESYIASHAEVKFSHGICPDCVEKARIDLGISASSAS